MSDVRILLADSHDVCRRGVRALLTENSGWIVCEQTNDGRHAVKMTLEQQPQIVILEIDLLSLNGIEATRQIKSARPSTEVLVYTTHDEERIIGEALRAGARGYVLKSDNEDKLVDAVTALARHVPFFSPSAAQTMLSQLLKFGPGASEMLPLTAREREIVCLLSDAKSNKQIAFQLHISIKTVESHRAAIMRKLGLKSITALVRYAIRNGFVQA